jgi:hypothetical protein
MFLFRWLPIAVSLRLTDDPDSLKSLPLFANREMVTDSQRLIFVRIIPAKRRSPLRRIRKQLDEDLADNV